MFPINSTYENNNNFNLQSKRNSKIHFIPSSAICEIKRT